MSIGYLVHIQGTVYSDCNYENPSLVFATTGNFDCSCSNCINRIVCAFFFSFFFPFFFSDGIKGCSL